LYVVKSGTIKLRDPQGNTLRTIEAGEYFGERALVHGGGYLYDALARGSTELVSLSGEVVLPFFRSSSRFRRVLGRTATLSSAEEEIDSVKGKLGPAMLRRPVREVMRTDIAALRSDASVGDALALFRERRFSIYPVIGPDGRLDGALAREDLFDYLKRAEVGEATPIAGVERLRLPV